MWLLSASCTVMHLRNKSEMQLLLNKMSKGASVTQEIFTSVIQRLLYKQQNTEL